jgi:YVTN family beta-propeller protein
MAASFKTRSLIVPLCLCGLTLYAPPARAKERRLPTGKEITPTGEQTDVGSFPSNMALSPDGRYLIVSDTGYREYVSSLRVADGKRISQIGANAKRKDGSNKKEGLYYGLAFGPSAGGATPVYVSRGAEDRIAVYSLGADGTLTDSGESLSDPSDTPKFAFPNHVAGLAASGDGTRLYAVNNNTGPRTGQKGSLSVLNVETGAVVSKIPLPGFPYAVAAIRTPDGHEKAYVSSERDGVVSVVDADAGRVIKEIPTGDHPIALLPDHAGKRLFVANSGSDTVSVIDAETDVVARTFLLRPDDARGLPGATPTGLALSPDESRLYVTLADMNAVAVVDTEDGDLEGYIPVGWYPTAVVCAGDRLFVANAKGVNVRIPNDKPAGPKGAWGKYIENIIEGTVSRIDLPDKERLQRFTTQTIKNNRLAEAGENGSRADFKNPGIRHVIYIIKENRTYDQVLGDLERGNGDPKLCLFPREVTPNLHAIAERFVLLDNFYVNAEVSGLGWNWSTSGMTNEYVERNVPYSYSGRGRAYDYEGRNNGVAVDLKGIPDVAEAPGGYIWDLCLRNNVDFRNYGCFTGQGDPSSVGLTVEPDEPKTLPNRKALLGKTDLSFRWFDLAYADSDAWVRYGCSAPKQLKSFGKSNAPSRFTEWKQEFDRYVKDGNLPPMMLIRMGRDHTSGTTPGQYAPRAMVADNDYAVGELVDAVSKSPYWKSTAIFVLEDDAQNGFDHVDAHRSPAYVISPYIRRNSVDHRFYNTDSVLRTMELLLGLPPMSQYDAVAPPLDVFGKKPENDAPFDAILPDRSIIAELNTDKSYRAKESSRLPFQDADAVPDDLLNDILWGALRPNVPKPPIRHSLSLSGPDDD